MKINLDEQIEIPEKVTVEIDKSMIKLKGEKGEIERRLAHPRIDISQKDNSIVLASKKATKREKTMTNTFKSHIKNMIKGVQEGFVYKLKICSGHFPMNVSVQNNEIIIKNFYGEKKPRIVKFAENVSVKVEGEEITVEGVNKELVGQTASRIEEICKRNRRSFDKRVFQSGIFIISKDGKEI